VLGCVTAGVVASGIAASRLGRDFLPPFNEGSAQINVVLPPGNSLETSNRIAGMVEQRLKNVPGVVAFGRRTGRAELDEHAEGVNMSEIIVTFDPASPLSREEVLADIREELTQVPGAAIAVEQPLQHVITQMLSGVKAQVGIKLYGDSLDVLRAKADEIKAAIAGVRGVRDLMVEPQIEIPQLRVNLDGDALAANGLNSADVNELVETAMNGRVVSEIVLGERKFDLLVRLDDPFRNDPQELQRMTLDLPRGGQIPLNAVAAVEDSSGPNTINRENVRRRIVVQCNTADRDLGSLVAEIQQRLALTGGEPGKENLYPVATVILGGLISSTLLDFFVRPALF